MATTAQTIWDRATQMSSLNDENLVPVTQVLDYIALFERNVFIRAARLNPEYFGTTGLTATRTAFTDTWDLSSNPGLVVAVTRAEVSAFVGVPYTGAAVGDNVSLISIRWPDLGVAPRGLLRGRKILAYKNELGTDNSNFVTVLNIFYSPLPAKLTSISQGLTLPDEWADLVTYPLAALLAVRDRRTDEEMQWLKMAGQELQLAFDEAVMVYDYSQKRALQQVPAIPLGFGQNPPPPRTQGVPR
jgi:hypothetical protein